MAGLSLVFDIIGRDRASGAFDSAGESAERAGRRGAAFGAVLGGAAVAGVGALVSVLKGGAEEFKGNQEAIAQFQAGLKTTGGAANVTAKQIQSLADSIEAKTGTDGAAVVSGAALLETFTKVRNEAGKGNDVFSRATQAGVDLAARGFGSVQSNAVLLGKALNDPVKGLAALGKQGVTFTAAQKATIKSLVATGDTLGAQKIILKEVEGQVGGSAEAYGKTLPGELARASAAFDGVKETIFKAVLPVLTDLLTFVNTRLLPGFQSFAEAVGPTLTRVATVVRTEILPAVTAAAGAVGRFLAAVPAPVLLGIGAAIGVVGTALAAAAAATAVASAAAAAFNAVLALNPFVLVAAAVVGLGVALVIAYRRSETFRAVVQSAFAAVRSAVAATRAAFQAGIDGIVSIMNGGGGRLGAVIRGVVAVFRAQLDVIIGVVRGAVHIVVGIFTGDFGKVRQGVVTALSGVLAYLRTVGGLAKAALGDLGGLLLNAGKELMAGLGRGILAGAKAAIDAVRNTVSRIKGFLPGSPVREGPLTSWNNGGAGLRLMDLLQSGIVAGSGGVQSALRSAVDVGDLAGMQLGGTGFINRRISAADVPAAAAAAGGAGGPTVEQNFYGVGPDVAREVRQPMRELAFALTTGG